MNVQCRTTAALIISLSAILVASARPAQCRPIALAQYGSTMALVQSDAAAASAGEPTAAKRAMAELQPILQSTVQSGAHSLVFADNRPIMAQMQLAQHKTDPDERAQQWTQIAQEIAQIRASLPAENRADTAASIQPSVPIATVLSGNEFASLPAPPKSIWEKIGDWIQKMLDKIHWPHPSTPSAPDSVTRLLPEGILIVVLVAAVGLIVYVTVVWLRNRDRYGRVGKEARDSGLAITLEEKELVATHNYSRLRELAQEAAARGDYRSAFRLVFLATLVFLDAEGAIKLDRSKTNWEYLRTVAGNSGLREQLRPFVRDFDRIWYGEQPAALTDYNKAGDGYTAIQQLIGSWATAAQPVETGDSSSPRKAAGVS